MKVSTFFVNSCYQKMIYVLFSAKNVEFFLPTLNISTFYEKRRIFRRLARNSFYVMIDDAYRRFYKTSKMIYVLVSAKNVEYFDDRRKIIHGLVTKGEKRYSDEKSKFDIRNKCFRRFIKRVNKSCVVFRRCQKRIML